jgi:hypothetical protein
VAVYGTDRETGQFFSEIATASSIWSASAPRPDPRINATRGVKFGFAARMMSAQYHGLFERVIRLLED